MLFLATVTGEKKVSNLHRENICVTQALLVNKSFFTKIIKRRMGTHFALKIRMRLL